MISRNGSSGTRKPAPPGTGIVPLVVSKEHVRFLSASPRLSGLGGLLVQHDRLLALGDDLF